MERSPLLKAASSEIDARRGERRSAGAIDPLELEAVPAGTFNDAPIIVTQTLDVLGQRSARSDVAQAQVVAQSAELDAATLSLRRAVSLAYIGLQAAIAGEMHARQSLEIRDSVYQIAGQRYDLGDVPEVHVWRTEIARDRAQNEVTSAATATSIAGARLATAIGRPDASLRPNEGLSLGEWPGYDLAELRDLAIESRPDLAALRAGAAAGRAAVAVARRERRPDLAVQYRTGKREGSSGTQIGLGLSMPLVDWGQISGSVKAARATVASQEQTLAQAELDAGLEVEEAYRQALSTREIAESYSERIGARAERLAEVFQMSYERGGSTLLEVIDAEETLTETQMSRVQATADHR
ncbi:MAG TPA: TolC family protein, partial [Armatimonadota bacterium]|nr:TolC family protein [Armatimonadota bacterium]